MQAPRPRMGPSVAAAAVLMVLLLTSCSVSSSTDAADAAAAEACEASSEMGYMPATNSGSPVQTDTAFVVDLGTNEVVLCAVSNGVFTACKGSKATSGGTPPLEFPSDVAVVGNKVYITESITPARLRVCSWSGLELTDCYASNIDRRYQRADGIVFDEQHSNVLFASVGSSSVVVCTDAEHLADCKDVKIMPNQKNGDPDNDYEALNVPVGLHIHDGHLWVAAQYAIHRCKLTPEGVNYESCSRTRLHDTPSAIVVHPSGSRVLFADAEKGFVSSCATAEQYPLIWSSCAKSVGNGTFYDKAAPEEERNNFPGVVGMDIAGGLLYVPTYYANAVSVCKNTDTATDCVLQKGTGHKFDTLTSIKVVPLAKQQ